MSKTKTIGKKIGFGYAIIVMILLFAVLLTLWKVKGMSDVTARLIELRSPTATASLITLNGINHSLAALRSWIILGEVRFKEERNRAWTQQIKPSLKKMFKLSANWTDPENVNRLKDLNEKLKLLGKYQQEIEEIAQTPENMPAQKILLTEAIPQADILMETITIMIDIEEHQKATQKRKKLLKVMADIRGTTGFALAAIRGFLLSGEENFKKEFEHLWKKNRTRYNELKQNKKLLTHGQKNAFERFVKAKNIFDPLPPRMFKVRSQEEWNLGNYWLKTKADPIALDIKKILEQMVSSQQGLMASDFMDVKRQIQLLNTIEWLLLILGVGFGLFLAITLTRSITAPIATAVNMANAIADGNCTFSPDIGGSLEIESLGNAMKKMRVNLISMSSDKDQQLWTANTRTKLSYTIRGEQDIVTLCKNIIKTLASLTCADIGAIYLSNEDHSLKLCGSYAYTDRKNNFNEFKPGEGLVGQAALEQNSILFTNVPEDIGKINYGTGETSPNQVLITPVLYEKKLKGVITLGTASEFSSIHKEFVNQISNEIAIALNTAQSREKIKTLLNVTKNQADNLKSQQQYLQQANNDLEEKTARLMESEAKLKIQREELQTTNEELEEQTKALIESESKLKVQREELQATNEELEEKTQYLERQKSEIELKNREVEKARKEIEAKAKDLEEISRYKSEFLANMSHELRTPLNSLLILARMFADNEEGNLTKDQVDSAKVIFSSGSDLLSLINEILDLSKVEAGKMNINAEDVKLEDLATNIRKNFKHLAEEKKIGFEIIKSDNLPHSIRTDRQKLEQVLKNLLSNAFKFTKNGTVTFKISRPAPNNDLKTRELIPGKSIALSVSDTGIGIPEERQKMIFEAFQQVDGTTSRKYGGTGLGLTISRQFTKLLQGDIVLQSFEGKGSTFTLYVPELLNEDTDLSGSAGDKNSAGTDILSSDQAQTPSSAPLSPSSVVAPGPDDREKITDKDKTILIIEDDLNFAKILFDMTHKRGFKGIIAPDGEKGVDLAITHKPNAIILDIMLPGIDGWVVMDRLKDNPKTRHIPVHFISALDENINAMKKGAIGYLSKPVNKEQLDNAFKRIAGFIVKEIKQLLVLVADGDSGDDIVHLLKGKDIKIIRAKTGNEAYKHLISENFDCMVTDMKLPDISIFELLNKIEHNEILAWLPVIIYTDKTITRDEDIKLKQYANSIIIRGVKSRERLLDETALFLHCVEKKFSPQQQKMIRMTHDKESILKEKKILIVDDDMRNTFALSRALKGKGMNVFRAENGMNALDILNKEEGMDIVLMDIMMPVMDGYETIQEIRKQTKFETLPILALTAKAMIGDKEKCIEAGANEYLSKPVDLEKMFSMLRVWLYQ